jgi:hypothetical protein
MLYYREDICTLWKLFNEKYGATKFGAVTYNNQEAMSDYIMWRALKLMFDPSLEESEWTEIRRYKVRKWMLFQSSGVHVLYIGPHTLYMLIEKDYPLASCLEIVYQMVNGTRQLKLQKAYDTDDQAFDLLSKYKKILGQQSSKKK